MKYTEFLKQQDKKVERLLRKAQVFWAFGIDQFNEGKEKYPLEEGFKYITIGNGGYFPGQNRQIYIDGFEAINAWEAEQLKNIDAEEAILYELYNHEGCYEDVIKLFDGIYSEEQIISVYRKQLISEPKGFYAYC